MTSTAKHHSTFPPEISTSFLDYLIWPEAWKNRIVCRAWQNYIENNVAPRVWLKDVEIIFGDIKLTVPNIYAIESVFKFQSITSHGFAVFTKKSCQATSGPVLVDRIESHGCFPFPITTMSDFAHDIKIPNLSVDWEAGELRLHWRDLFVQFFSTENRALDRWHESLRKQHDNVRKMRARIDGGHLGELEAFRLVFEIAGDSHDEAYRETRAERLRASKIFLRDPYGDKALKQIRQSLSFRNTGEEGKHDKEGGGDQDEEDDGEEAAASEEELWMSDDEDSTNDSVGANNSTS